MGKKEAFKNSQNDFEMLVEDEVVDLKERQDDAFRRPMKHCQSFDTWRINRRLTNRSSLIKSEEFFSVREERERMRDISKVR
ncbi:hypothetical protein TNCT_97821 [Trichonephila clavata]|uniref:Uncharacterized protein n=1 Tax=Trichonephila clavata TaxID=2740835 RepID=A0A8X6FK83_TRICU|nr:hypothetical protein TNCT_97821 [Trichonephila clavata]